MGLSIKRIIFLIVFLLKTNYATTRRTSLAVSLTLQISEFCSYAGIKWGTVKKIRLITLKIDELGDI